MKKIILIVGILAVLGGTFFTSTSCGTNAGAKGADGAGMASLKRQLPADLPDNVTELVQEFFLGLTRSAGMTLHIKLLAGTNTHHIIECVFKAFGRALTMATGMSMIRPGDIPSTKGVL